jgi:hypothetical protein
MLRVRTFLVIGILSLGLPHHAFAVGDCGWSDKMIDGRGGDRPGNSVDFKFDSRFEKFSNTADKYIWCIENTNRYFVTGFRWGNIKNDKLYYSNLVEPRKSVPTSSTFSLGSDIGIRFIKFKHTYEDEMHWKPVDVETVFPIVLGKADSRSQLDEIKPYFKLAQADTLDAYRFPSGQVDVERLSANRALFEAFIDNEPIVLNASTIVTIPTSLSTLYQLEAGKYEKYQPSDFIRVSVSFENIIQIFNGLSRSDVSLSSLSRD